MSTKKSWVLILLLTGGLSFAATAPVAMRVEVEPTRQAGALTEVVVVVQVSPEDRLRIGSNAILRIELDGGTVSSGSPMRAVRLEDDGSARVFVEWPPGEHHLRVEIEDPSKEDTGLWVGTVRIPDLSPGTVTEKVSDAEPEPLPVAVPENPEPEIQPPPGVDDAIDASPTEAAATTPEVIVVEEPVSEPAPTAEVSEGADAIVKTTPDSPVSETPTIVESAAVGAVAASEIPELETEEILGEIEQMEPEPVAVAESIAEEPTIDEIAPQIEQPTEMVEETPLVEPLRADPPPQTREPEASTGHQQLETAPGLVPVSAELAGRYEDWGDTDPKTREFSIILLRGREPATGIAVSGLRLRVGGSEVPVERLGDVESAPLLLGLAIDVASDEVESWSGMRGSLSPIVGRTEGGRGRLFVATRGGIGAWDADTKAPGGVTLAQKSENVARLVMASIEKFEGVYGRTFLVVLTDGRNEPVKEEWQQATAAAGAAGVPILVIALWDDDFNNRTRKNLKKLTDISGGSLFLVQGRAQLESAADRFGRYLDGGYSIRFNPPGGEMQSVTTISVSASDKEVDVSAPKSIR